MKKIVLLTAAFTITLAGAALAQDKKSNAEYISIGPVIGFSHNWVSNMYGSNKLNAGGYIGAGLVYSKDPHWAWGGQVTFSKEGYRVGDPINNISTGIPVYLRIPLRAYYFFGNYGDDIRPKVYLGPSFGIKLAESDDTRGGDVLNAQNIGPCRTFEAGINAGVGMDVRVKKGVWFDTDLGYTQGLTDAVKDPAGTYNTSQNLAISFGLLFGIR